MGELDPAAAHEAGSRFESMIEESFVVLMPDRNDFDRARDWVNRFETGLRAGDALHLAIADNRRADAIYSLDRSMVAAATQLGLPATEGILLSEPQRSMTSLTAFADENVDRPHVARRQRAPRCTGAVHNVSGWPQFGTDWGRGGAATCRM